MKRIYSSPVFERCIPFPTPLKGNITKLFKVNGVGSVNVEVLVLDYTDVPVLVVDAESSQLTLLHLLYWEI